MTLFANDDVWSHIQSYFTPLEKATIAEVCKGTPKPRALADSSNICSPRVCTIDLAARRGYKGIVKSYHRRGHRLTSETFRNAVESGSLKLVRWMERKDYMIYNIQLLKLMAKKGYLNMIKWYRVKYSYTIPPDVLHEAASHGQLKIVKWFYWLYSWQYDFGKVMEIAAERRYDSMFKWCIKHQCKVTQRAFTSILIRGDLDLAELCVKYASHLLPLFSSAMWAAEGGNLEVLRLCVAKGAKIERHYVLSRAIANNDLPMVQWLIEQGTEVDDYSVENAQKLSDQTIYNYLVSL